MLVLKVVRVVPKPQKRTMLDHSFSNIIMATFRNEMQMHPVSSYTVVLRFALYIFITT
jgi:hypothetical protein